MRSSLWTFLSVSKLKSVLSYRKGFGLTPMTLSQDNNYNSCPGGAARHYDMSLWLTSGMNGGAGGDWGQRVGSEYFLSALDNPHIWLHEFVIPLIFSYRSYH